MTPRERVLKAIRFVQPDRPPIFATLTPQAAQKLSKAVGLAYEPPFDSLLSTRISHPHLLTTLGNDCVGIAACAPKDSPTRTLESGVLVNEWGMKFVDVGLYAEFAEFPLSYATTPKDIQDYPFPDPYAEGRFDIAEQIFAKYAKDYAVVADLETSFFETAWYLVGLDKLLADMATGEAYVYELFDTILEINLAIGKRLIEIGADIIWAGDDFGTQQGMLISPTMWREIFKPRIKYMFDEFRRVNPDIKIAWHSCGSIFPIIPDFIEIGLDILNPIQPLAKDMEASRLKETFGSDLVFFGGIDIQHLLPHETPAVIAREVKRMARILGEGGGYIIAPAHNIQDDTPVENILAFFDTVKAMEK